VHGRLRRVFRYTTNAALRPAMGWRWPIERALLLKDMEIRSYIPRASVYRDSDHGSSPRRRRIFTEQGGLSYLQDYNLGTPEPKPVLRTTGASPRDRLSQAVCSRNRRRVAP